MVLERHNIHFIGIGGIGMSGLALIMSDMGYSISGSDAEANVLTDKLKRKGVNIYAGHNASNLNGQVEAVVYSSSISPDNPELKEANKRGIPVIKRGALLGELMNRKEGIAIAGTHGKTTTTSLVSVMLENLRIDPTVVIGGEVELFGGNAKLGGGDYFVAEADESDGSFLCLNPKLAVITNVEQEHMDYYKTMDKVVSAYSSFAHNIKDGGSLIYYHQDKHITHFLKDYDKDMLNYGFDEHADMSPANVVMKEFTSSYDCIFNKERLGRVELRIPGRHNILNSMAAILVGLKMDFSFSDIAGSIAQFSGAKRRFSLRAEAGGVMLIEDYAHHPTEIKAVLDACRNWKNKRTVVIFQPHRYSRTDYLAEEFGACFKEADKLILTDVYAASEDPIKGVSVKNIYDKVLLNGKKDVSVMKKEDIADHVMNIKKPGDMILVLGAGDIRKVADKLSQLLTR